MFRVREGLGYVEVIRAGSKSEGRAFRHLKP